VDAVAAAVRPNTKLIFSESPTNPYLNVVDLEALAGLAKKRGILTILDATFATPYNQRPLEFGVDIELHSATKYLGGHNDIMAGYIAGREDLIEVVKTYQGMFGPVPGPMTCYLLARGLKTFALRMERHNQNGQQVAEFLEGHPKVLRTYYPGLRSHPSHKIAKRQMRGFGGVVSFEMEGSLEDCGRFVDALKLPYIAPSFGGVESLIGQPALMSFFDMSSEQRAEIGIKDNLVRLAVGIEDTEDLIADLAQALETL
jgi:cystathionine gamma-synthase